MGHTENEYIDHVAEAIKSTKRGPVYDESYKLAEVPRLPPPYDEGGYYIDGKPVPSPPIKRVTNNFIDYTRNVEQEKRDIAFQKERGRGR